MTDHRENAKLAFRQLRRQTEADPPASDVEEMAHYVKEAYERLRARADQRFEPEVYARSLAEKAARAYAKKEYTGQGAFEERFERAFREWADRAAAQFHRDDLRTRPHKKLADKKKARLKARTNKMPRPSHD